MEINLYLQKNQKEIIKLGQQYYQDISEGHISPALRSESKKGPHVQNWSLVKNLHFFIYPHETW